VPDPGREELLERHLLLADEAARRKLSLLQQLEHAHDAGGGGEFEVSVDGRLVFSKKAAGRFPDVEEVLAAIPA